MYPALKITAMARLLKAGRAAASQVYRGLGWR
jgi:hypothetical protein